MDNIELFEYSLKNTEHIFDDANKKEKIIITKDAHKTNKPIKNNERLIGLITSYQTMRGKLSKKQEDDLVGEIDSILFNNSHMNYTAFAQYLMVWDMPYSSLSCEREEDRMPLLRELINKYINDRHQMYLSHGYSNIVLQVLADNYFDKDTFYLLPDRGDNKYFRDICSKHNVKFRWSKSKQGKMPDFYIQKASNAWIIEHKHKKGSGGGQYSQVVELVDFLKYTDKNISYVAFLDGIMFNELINASCDNKMSKAKRDIYRYLRQNKNNYFVNTAGFIRLLKTIK